MPFRSILVILATMPIVASCGTAGEATLDGDCVSSVDPSVPLTGDPDRRIEDIIEAMTGERQTGDHDPVEQTIDDPNFAGVYGDFNGGIIVTVVDCSDIDIDEIAEIAGGTDAVTFVEVAYNWWQVDGFRDTLVEELRNLDVPFDVPIISTVQGRGPHS